MDNLCHKHELEMTNVPTWQQALLSAQACERPDTARIRPATVTLCT